MSEDDGKIGCKLCGARVHIMRTHLQDDHNMTEDEYVEMHPDAPLLSPTAIERLAVIKKQSVVTEESVNKGFPEQKTTLHEAFGLGDSPAAFNARTKKPIPMVTYSPPAELEMFVPEVDPNHVFDIDLLKTIMLGVNKNVPMLLWGMSGTGKTTTLKQVCARLRAPWLRIQHTRNMEERDVVGMPTLKDGEVRFQLGPLAFAMKNGLVYCADEYDFGMPAVLSLYQGVMEGEPLVIKDADPENRVIRPHPNFRFVATGNTNGTGDETGLYQGTLIQNAANYERFGIVEEVKYMDPKAEIAVVAAQGGVTPEIAEKLVNFAKMCREAYAAQKIGLPPSPRAMINAAKLGRLRGDVTKGIRLAYMNRLSRIDQEVCSETLRRISL